MNMNKRFLIPALAWSLLALSFAGCTDDNMSGSDPLPEGTEFDFGTTVESNRSRTYYDPTDENNPAATSWKIFWNYESSLYDHIYIYSPQALTSANQASYTVQATAKDFAEPAPVVKDGDVGVQTSDASSYNFYAMYPAQFVRSGSGTGTSLSATMPVEQTVSTTETMTDEAVGTLQTAADMNCALMIAKTENYTPTAENQAAVQLQFTPFASMIDITVNGTAQDNMQGRKVRITSVIIEADAPIAGDFTYNYNTDEITFGEGASNSITVDTKFADTNGDKEGVMMGNDSQLKVRAFMIPNPNVKSLKVKVVTAESKTMTKTLAMESFQPRQIHSVKLPKIDIDNLKFDYTIWLSQLDPNIYISEISLPGSALSFNYLMSQEHMKTQTKNLSEQFNAGVRVFQCHVNTISQTSTIDGGSTSVGIAASDGSNVSKGNGSYWTLGDVLTALQKEMSGIHKDEFCVLAISDWIKDVNADKLSALYSRLNAVLDEAGKMGLVATNITPETTIGDIKGKVIIKLQLNGGYTNAWTQLNNSKVWMNTYAEIAETTPYYSPMPYGKQPATNAGGTSALALTGDMNIIYSDCANPVKSEFSFPWRDGVRNNATAILSAYEKNYNSTDHKNFAMTYLGGCGAKYTTVLWSTTYYYNPSEVASILNKLWLENKSKPAAKPWGWVMFNLVGDEMTTTQGIEAVIEHNSVFKLARRSAAKTKPSGDTKGIASGGTVF